MTKFLVVFLSVAPLIFPAPAYAHAFGILYNLPVPFWLYLWGAAAALIISFLIIGFFLNQTKTDFSYPSIKLNFSIPEWLKNLAKIKSVFLLIFVVLTGLIGTQSVLDNFNMTFFWIIFLLGFTYLIAIFGDIYGLINPRKVIIEWLERISGKEIKGLIKYPEKLGIYPALFFYFYLIYVELFLSITPFKLSLMIMQYTIITFLGVFIFGKIWFERGEFLGIFFNLISKISIIEKSDRLFLRPPFVGLMKESAGSISVVLFILFMLSSTAYDGFHSTIPWVQLSFHLSQILDPILGDSAYILIQKTGLFLSPFLFLSVYGALIWLMKIITQTQLGVLELLKKFSFSLIPIAFAYNVAHYYTLVLTQGQEMIRIISDPFGFNWNLFGTAGYSSNIGIVNAGFVWHSQVAIILIGHIAAVYLAHLTSLKIFPTHKKAMTSQLPMLILMVIYTTFGLWILSQPIR